MTSAEKPTRKASPKVERLRELIRKRDEIQAAILAERYDDLVEVETEDQRIERIHNTPEAWR